MGSESMDKRLLPATTAVLFSALIGAYPARAAETPSFLQVGEVFCTDENDFESFRQSGRMRVASAVETCVRISDVTRVAVRQKYGSGKAMIRVMGGAYNALIGWTNGALP